jgi:hypothetical protein
MNGVSLAPQQVWSDLLEALRVWQRKPILPLVTVGLTLGATGAGLPDDVRWVTFPCLLLWLGFASTEALWYLRLFRDKDLLPQQIWRLSWTFFWRNLWLALALGVPSVVLIVLNADLGSLIAAFLSCLLVAAQVSLAFRTRSAPDAVADAVALIRSAWPLSVVYLLPVLAVSLVGLFAYRFDAMWAVVSTGIAAAVTSVSKGALTRLYVRVRGPISDVGSSEDSATWRAREVASVPPVARSSTGRASPHERGRRNVADRIIGLALSVVFWFAFGSTGSFGFQRASVPPELIPALSVAGIVALVLAWLLFAAEPVGRYLERSGTRSDRGTRFDARRGCVWLLISWPLAIVVFVIGGLLS